ncbi:MAG: alanine racemase [Thermodesulfovibrio aggregans]|uniref:Alanine racemase n=1 Tax=Thermodesulfovibrio aggregans TaxID=86166 RepID=A0A2J6WQY1_9BACT|nr:MAG: alanine racemase [Thermodesulfovibrio aggregans]
MRLLEAEIDLKALIHNFHTVKAIVKPINPSCRIIAIVKADAYGHGAVEVTRALEKRCFAFGVAFFEEAAILREAGIKSKIIVLFDREVEGIFKYNLTPVVFDFKQAQLLSKQAQKKAVNLSVHVKVETGMGRLGIYNAPCETIKKIAQLPNIKIEGVMSHLSEAENKEWTTEQIRKFKEIQRCIVNLGISPVFHIANSQGIKYPEALFDAVRPGLMLYGYGQNFEKELKPCMKVKTKIIDIRRLPKGSPISYGRTFITKKNSVIGVIPVGYADGYFRKLTNRAKVIVRGKKVPVVGTVCMDLTMIDLTDIREVKVDDEVILLGDLGNEKITAQDIAEWAETIPYEVLTSLGSHAKRKYIREEVC